MGSLMYGTCCYMEPVDLHFPTRYNQHNRQDPWGTDQEAIVKRVGNIIWNRPEECGLASSPADALTHWVTML